MKKYYGLFFVLLACVLMTSCTNDDDMISTQTTAEEGDIRKGKIAADVVETSDAQEDEDDGRKGKISAKVSDSDKQLTKE